MPGRHVTDRQVRLYMQFRQTHHATIFEMNVESYRGRVALDRKRGPVRPPARAATKTAP